MRRGEGRLADIIDADRDSPVVAFDDHGGNDDHVPAPERSSIFGSIALRVGS